MIIKTLARCLSTGKYLFTKLFLEERMKKSKWILAGLLILAMSFIVGCSGDPVVDEPPPPVVLGPWTVTFDVDGGTEVPNQIVEHNGFIDPVTTTKEGHAFLGWFSDPDFIFGWDFDNSTVTENMTLYAEWYDESLGFATITFNSNGGTEVDPIEDIILGETIEQPEDPTKGTDVFDGWYRDAALTIKWDFFTNEVWGSFTLHAKWLKLVTVTFDSNGGSAVASRSFAEGLTTMRPVPTRADHHFRGWFRDNNTFLIEWDFNDPITADITLYAKWEAIQYALIQFVTNEATLTVEDRQVEVGTRTRRPRDIKTRGSGSTMEAVIGWYKDAELTQEFDFITDVVPGPMTLYAEWGPAVGVWLSSNHAPGTGSPDGITTTNQWDGSAQTNARRLHQRKDGTFYFDVYESANSNRYFRFMAVGTFDGVALNGKFQPPSNNFRVPYGTRLGHPAVNYHAGTANGLSYEFSGQGWYSFILDPRGHATNGQTLTIIAPNWSIESIDIDPPTRTGDALEVFDYQFNANITGTNAPELYTWTLIGATGGSTIDQTGKVSVTDTESIKTMTIRVASKMDTSIYAEATLNLVQGSLVPIVTALSVSPTNGSVMKAANADGTIQMHTTFPIEQHRGLQLVPTITASGPGVDRGVTYSIVEQAQVKPGTAVSETGFVTVALNETLSTFNVRVTPAQAGFANLAVDVPITVKSFEVFMVGAGGVADAWWGRADSNYMTDNGNGTYTWKGIFNVANAREAFTFNTNKSTGGGTGGAMGWQTDAWYILSATQLVANGTYPLTAGVRTDSNSQTVMFGVAEEDVGTEWTLVLDVTVPNVTITQSIIPATDVEIRQTGPLTVFLTRTQQLNANYIPSAASTNRAITWSSDAPDVATVSPSGLVTGVSSGTANITVTLDSDTTKTSTIVVNVTPIPLVQFGRNNIQIDNFTARGTTAPTATAPAGWHTRVSNAAFVITPSWSTDVPTDAVSERSLSMAYTSSGNNRTGTIGYHVFNPLISTDGFTQLTFWAKASNTSHTFTVVTYYGSTITERTVNFTIPSADTWHPITVNLPGTAPQQADNILMLAFRVGTSGNVTANSLLICDVELSNPDP